LILLLSACGAGAPAAATGFPDIPAATENPLEQPAEELPAQEVQSTQDTQDASTSPPVIAFSTSTALPTTGGPGDSPAQSPAAIPERRFLALEFPPQIRVGDSDRVRLALEVDALGNLTPTAEVAGNVVVGEMIAIPNLYETHTMIAEARFDIAGLQVSPPDLVGQPLAQGQSVSFYWSILPNEVGVFRGTVWLYLRFVERISGEESQRAVSAQPVEIEAVNLFGLSGSLARAFGLVGSVAGTVIGFPFFEDIVRLLFRRRKRKR
jgi:hypothetical protein